VRSSAPVENDAIAADMPGISVFDRLRAGKKGKATAPAPVAPQNADADADSDAARPPKPATLDDVADAIAAARLEPAPSLASMSVETPASAAPPADIETSPAIPEETGWKTSVVTSINDTRDELKRAHESVTKIRRQIADLDRRRRKRRVQIAASLDRAQSLLSEFQNAWR
jgi:hypothetical protein